MDCDSRPQRRESKPDLNDVTDGGEGEGEGSGGGEVASRSAAQEEVLCIVLLSIHTYKTPVGRIAGWLHEQYAYAAPPPTHPITSHPIPSFPILPHPTAGWLHEQYDDTAPSSTQPILSHPIPSHPNRSYMYDISVSILSHPISSHPISSHLIPSHLIPSHPIPSQPILQVRHLRTDRAPSRLRHLTLGPAAPAPFLQR
jgi:hypothetical protein